MKQLLITIAAVVLVGCGKSQQSAPVSTKTVLSNPSSLSREDSYRLSASEIEAIADKPHDPIWSVPKLSRLVFRPGAWERHDNGRTQFKKMKYVGGNNVVIENSLTYYKSPKIATEIHSFDSTSNTMYFNVLIHPTREIRRATGVVNIEERSVNRTSQFDSNESEKLTLKLKLKFENDGRGATLNGNRSKNGVLISQINAKLKLVANLPSSVNTEPKKLKN